MRHLRGNHPVGAHKPHGDIHPSQFPAPNNIDFARILFSRTIARIINGAKISLSFDVKTGRVSTERRVSLVTDKLTFVASAFSISVGSIGPFGTMAARK